jgi:hypothetical protein
LVGNYLLSAYQYLAWVRQRRFEKKAESIQYLYDLFAELTSLMSKRRYAMLKLVYALRKNDKDRINNARIEYKKYLDEWNTKLNAFLYQSCISFRRRRDDVFRRSHQRRFCCDRSRNRAMSS